MAGCLDFLKRVYGVFDFKFDLCLSTRPEKFMGEIAMWDSAEEALKESLDAFGQPWRLNPGDGAFYGPKIDITIQDALQRSHQCATIQLDFQLPIRFNLSYVSETGEKVPPVIIHRAVYGSVERMIAILTESFAGKWPFWLSPRQVMIVPVGPMFDDYAEQVKQKLYDAGFMVEVDTDPGDTMNKKIRNAQFNFILDLSLLARLVLDAFKTASDYEKSSSENVLAMEKISLDDGLTLCGCYTRLPGDSAGSAKLQYNLYKLRPVCFEQLITARYSYQLGYMPEALPYIPILTLRAGQESCHHKLPPDDGPNYIKE
nr:unnamed protein product [Callosobruchus chinensis]